MITLRPIGVLHTPWRNIDECPRNGRQPNPAPGCTAVVLPEFLPGLRSLEGFSHLILLYWMHGTRGPELTFTPPFDGEERGVFATRSPRRPNPIGLTVVELLAREGTKLRVRGIDMLDGTPILDIKPYLSSIPMDRLRRGWLDEAERRSE